MDVFFDVVYKMMVQITVLGLKLAHNGPKLEMMKDEKLARDSSVPFSYATNILERTECVYHFLCPVSFVI